MNFIPNTQHTAHPSLSILLDGYGVPDDELDAREAGGQGVRQVCRHLGFGKTIFPVALLFDLAKLFAFSFTPTL